MATATEDHIAPQSPLTSASTTGLVADARQTALRDAGLLREIFMYLRVPALPVSRISLPDLPPIDHISRSETRRMLGRAAIVCRAFSEPARDALWSSIDSVKPIFRALGMETNVVTRFRELPPGFSDLTRRIVEINHHPQSEESPISPSALMHFASFVSNSHSHDLFRSLRVLRCTLSTEYGFEMLKLTGPSLTHLALYNITEEMIPAINQAMVDLLYTSPLLKVLELRRNQTKNDFEIIGGLQSLTSLSITSTSTRIGVRVKMLKSLAVLPSLQHLEIDAWNGNFQVHEWKLQSSLALKSVKLRGNAQALIGFLSAIEGAESLNDLDVTIVQGPLSPESSYASKLSNELVRIGQDSIRHLSIVDEEGILTELRPVPHHNFHKRKVKVSRHQQADRFTQFLLHFTAPERLIFQSPAIYLRDGELDSIIETPWPGNTTLRTFSMPNPSRVHAFDSNYMPPPMNKLHELMEVFPHLEYLQLFFAITSSNIPDPDTFTPQRHFQLKVLGLGSLTTAQEFDNFVNDGTIFRLAGYINKLFPELKELRYDETSTVQTNLWRLVFRAIEFKRK